MSSHFFVCWIRDVCCVGQRGLWSMVEKHWITASLVHITPSLLQLLLITGSSDWPCSNERRTCFIRITAKPKDTGQREKDVPKDVRLIGVRSWGLLVISGLGLSVVRCVGWKGCDIHVHCLLNHSLFGPHNHDIAARRKRRICWKDKSPKR